MGTPGNQIQQMQAMQELQAKLKSFDESMKPIIQSARDLAGGFTAMASALQGVGQMLDTASKGINNLNTQEEERVDAAGKSTSQLLGQEKRTWGEIKGLIFGGSSDRIEALEDEIDVIERNKEKMAQAGSDTSKIEGKLVTKRKQLNRLQSKATGFLGKWGVSLSSMGETGSGVSAAFGKATNVGKTFLTSQKALNKSFLAAGRSAAFATTASFGLTAGLGILVTGIMAAIGRFSEAQAITRSFAGTMLQNEASLRTFYEATKRNAAMMAWHNIKAEDYAAVMSGVAKGYGMASAKSNKFGLSVQDYTFLTADAIASTMKYTNVVGVSTKEAGELISTMGILGDDLTATDKIFERLAGNAAMAGINVDDMTRAATKLGRVNVLAKTSTLDNVRALSMWGEGVKNSSNALLDGANKAAMAAKVIEGIADASARLDMGTVLAFGAAMNGVSGTLDEMTQKALGVPREEIFKRFMTTVGDVAGPGQAKTAKMILAQQLGITDLNTSFGVAVSEIKKQATDAGRMQKEATESNKAAKTMAALSAKTVGILTRLTSTVGRMSEAAILNLPEAAFTAATGIQTSHAVLRGGRGTRARGVVEGGGE